MATKLFSFLGANNYGKIKYYLDSKDNYYESRFIQEALVELIGESNIKTVMFLTEKAREMNWKTRKEIGLNELLRNSSFNKNKIDIPENKVIQEFDDDIINVECVDIPDCVTEKDIWEVFNLVYNQIEEGDDIYVDITHSFRSIPIIFISVLNYAKKVKNIEIKRILYGAYEAREDGYAPIIDITQLNNITEWSFGVDHLLKSGNSTEFSNAVLEQALPMYEKSNYKDKTIRLIKDTANSLTKFFDSLKFVRGKELETQGNNLKANLLKLRSINKDDYIELKPFLNLIDLIYNQVEFIKKDQSKSKLDTKYLISNINGCIELCKKFQLYKQAYTLLQENLISYICIKINKDVYKYHGNRKIAERLILYKYITEVKNHVFSPELEEGEKVLLRKNLWFITSDIGELYDNLSQVRNDLNHAEYKTDTSSVEIIMKDFDKYYEKFIIIYSEYEQKIKDKEPLK